MTFVIKSNWIKEIREGRNPNWNYDYKEYVFNENYTASAWIRIPLNAPGIKAMNYSNGSGIEAEYNQVYLDNDGTISTIFDVRYTDADHVAKLTEEKDTLASQYKNASQNAKTWESVAGQREESIRDHEVTIQEQAQEILNLKAKLYDLMDVGA